MEAPKLKDPESFRQLAALLGEIAEHHSHISMDTLTLVRWSDTNALMREVDDMIDDQNIPADHVLNRLYEFDEFHDRYPSLAPNNENLSAHRRLHATAEKIISTEKQLAAATTLDAYILHRTEEAHATAQLFEDSASEAVRSQPELQQNFIPLLQALGEAACFLDSAKDLPKDYRAGRTQLQPTFSHRRQLLNTSFSKLPEFTPLLTYPRVRTQLGRAATIHIARRF